MGRRTEYFHIPLPRSSLASVSPPGALRKEYRKASIDSVLLLESCLFSPPEWVQSVMELMKVGGCCLAPLSRMHSICDCDFQGYLFASC